MAFDLKQEGDVKEYVEKLGVEYRFGCYNEKKPDGKWVLWLVLHLSSAPDDINKKRKKTHCRKMKLLCNN